MTVESRTPFLRTLAPMLRGLHQRLQMALEYRRSLAWPMMVRSELEGIAQDLLRKSEGLDYDQPLLVVMLMGGTGVGKSTLMNALAGASVAQASFSRPTTRDPVIYFHHAVHPDKLDPALRLCRLVRHDREALRDKIIVDTPDVDSNDLLNREKLFELIPLADVVLFVGSQEKYHDQIVWDVFKSQRQRMAFAFVLNKWDRCRDPGATGLRPDDDLLQDLRAEGFEQPKLFRTVAQAWVDHTAAGKTGTPTELPPGEQFAELQEWLERGLTRLEIDAVKARGVDQLLAQCIATLKKVIPSDYSASFKKTTQAWQKLLREEAEAQTEVLLNSLEPYQNEIEHYFSTQGHQRFRGLMAGYLRVTTKLRYVGSTLRDRFSISSSVNKNSSDSPWDLQSTIHTAARGASDRILATRMTTLRNRLLVETEQNGLPMELVQDSVERTTNLAWDDRIARNVLDSITAMETEILRPTGWRKLLRDTVGLLGNFLPELVLVGSIILLLYRFFIQGLTPEFFHVLLPVYVTLGVLILLHVLILTALPIRWPVIRAEFKTRLLSNMNEGFQAAFQPLLKDSADALQQERKQIEALIHEVESVIAWLKEHEQATQVNELYGKA